MKSINKTNEPVSLRNYRRLPDAIYDGPKFTVVKNKIRESLLNEQGYLCAYCMRRISITTMKVEHWAPQHSNPALQLVYNNLLGCCKGNEGLSAERQTCDTKKGGKALLFSPSDSTHNIDAIVKYSGSGKVSFTNKDFDRECNDVLNLNEPRLKRNRELALEALSEELRKKGAKRRTKVALGNLITKYRTKDCDGKLREYYGMLLYVLTKKHKQAP